MKVKHIPLLLLFVVGLAACKAEDKRTLEQEAENLLKASVRFHCMLKESNLVTKSLWDSVAQNLDRMLPEDMPEAERRNMMAVRNTDLIKMFKVYPTLDSATRNLVEGAGAEDQELAAKLRSIKDSLDANEEMIRMILVRIEQEAPSRLAEWKKRFDTAGCE